MKRVFSITLVLCICISLLTVGANAADMLLISPAPPFILPAPSQGNVKTDGYSDVDDSHWAKDAIYHWTEKDVLQGNPDGTFAPDDYMTNAQYATFISKAVGLQNTDLSVLDGFSDTDKTMWYAQAMANCVGAGVIGDGVQTFAPDEYITREQAVVMMCRAYGIEPLDDETPNFIDAMDISSNASGYIAALAQSGALKGYPDKTLKPKSCLTRAEAVHLTAQTVELVVATASYELKAVIKTVRDGNKTVSDSAGHLMGISGITGELCYMASSNADVIASVYADSKLVDLIKETDDAFNTGGAVWKAQAEKIESLMTGDQDFIEAFVNNAHLSSLEQGKEYTVVLGAYELTVSVITE